MTGRCLFCDGNPDEPNHFDRCDGRQGHVEARYPDAPGWKEPTTSREAAATVEASVLRRAVHACLELHGALTADECARELGLSILSIRPRFSELRAQGLIADTGVRHLNASGKRAVVWALVAQGVHV